MAVGWQQKLADGRWRAFESHGSGPSRVQANAVRETRRDARQAAKDAIERKLRRTIGLEPKRLTLEQYLSRYADHRALVSTSGDAVAKTRYLFGGLPKDLLAVKLTKVAPIMLQKLIDGYGSTHAPATTHKLYSSLHSALSKAVDWRLLADNPMDAVTAPRPTFNEVTALSEDELAALLERLRGTRFYGPALLSATTGMRRGEVLALHWSDVDVKQATIRVRYATDAKPKGALLKEPKSAQSRRTVSLMAATVTMLREQKKALAAERLRAAQWDEQGLVFPAPGGGIWLPQTFSSRWSKLHTGIRFHDLRHTHATQLIRAGVPITAVSKRLGHKDASITARVYAHVLADEDAAAVALLEKRLLIPATSKGTS